MIYAIIAFFLFLILGMPIAFVLGISGLIYFLLNSSELSLTVPVQLSVSQTQNFSLLAIPLFVLSGNLLNESGITKRLLHLASVLAGRLPAGLAQANIVLATLMGGITGSAIADASMQARVLGEPMVEKKYSRGFVASVLAFASLIVIAIPPGIGLVLYGTIAEVSVGRLFAAGIVPGLLFAIIFMIITAIIGKKRGYKPEKDKVTFGEVIHTLIRCIWAFLFPFLLIFGLRMGLFTPSEVGAFAVVYAILVGILAYRELSFKKFMEATEKTIGDIGMVMLILIFSTIFGYGFTWEMIPQKMAEALLHFTSSPTIIMLIMMFMLFILGMFVDSTALILLLTPILAPVARAVGADMVHFGLILVFSAATGLITPPVGAVMYIVCSVLKCSVGEYIKEGWPFMLAVILVLLLILFVPNTVLIIPNAIFGK
ncbi:TRAP dicarboxylate transporter, DctM subunit [Caldicellulosiruptor hydrothermalis 108]|uniref:TRAP dicarboxylate transporter, DctM subunit n=1 Tax=Caldicellulosiruptor hydrothermalis (strain DSM 18901 / VKM B-2411 / 108) TaxID=632292 RepID=E4QCF4_CALH1|nr:TRAP transporter large permease [Caldicellulosiruptor hydrothermalis]ADQ06250.1 TRAP dicarboxylate transporter, DctM subunit [Caldicellulosiruptor hydrothermalis 108]